MIVDDHPVFREALRSFLETTEFTTVADAEARAETPAMIRMLRPQVAVIDVRTKSGDAWDMIASIRRESPETAVLVLTAYDTDAVRGRAADAGASYLPKGSDGAEVLACLRRSPSTGH